MWNRFIAMLISLGLVAVLSATPAQATILTFNSDQPVDNAATRLAWLAAVGIAAPQHLVNFESGFVNNQNISGVPGLFPAGLIIRDTSGAAAAIIRSGAGTIGGSNPVGVFSVLHNELAFLELDFSANPVDYVAFQDIDQAGTTGVVTFVGGGTANISFETTGVGGDTAEFFGIFRNDLPRITRIQLDASGDGQWGMDTIEYGVVPEASSLTLFGIGGLTLMGFLWRRRKPVM